MVVVTGSKGVIGRVVVKQLLESGIAVEEVSRDIFDLSSGKDLTQFVDETPEAIIHLAAAVPYTGRYLDTEETAKLTNAIDHCVLDAARAWKARVVYSSGCSLYVRSSRSVLTEQSPIENNFTSPYLKAKKYGENLFINNSSCAILRVSAPIGPGLSEMAVAMKFYNLAISSQPINIWGSGTREQNYVDVRDIANAMVLAAKSNKIGVYNISSDAPVTMYELASNIIKVVGQGSIEMSGDQDVSENIYARYSNKLAGDVLGWRPTYALNDSIETMGREK